MTRLIGQPLDRGSARGASGIRAGQHRGEDRTRAHREVAVAIAVGPAPSGIYALKDEAPGSYRGITIDLATALAKKLGVPIEYIPYLMGVAFSRAGGVPRSSQRRSAGR